MCYKETEDLRDKLSEELYSMIDEELENYEEEDDDCTE